MKRNQRRICPAQGPQSPNFKRGSALLLALSSVLGTAVGQDRPDYRNPRLSVDVRAQSLLRALTADEKMDLLTGTDFTTRPIPRLRIPAMAMADAGQGVRGGSSSTMGPATAFPAGVNMASSWDIDLVGKIGAAIGREALNKGTGVQVLLGPAVNIHRSPLGGRNGEYFSEDPFLASRLGVSYIKGMQSTGCAACVKHYAANNEEVDRFFVNTIVKERALREIYLPAFEAAVKEGDVWTVMSAYNKVNGLHASANPYLLTDVLRTDWGYQGMVMSDWGGVHDTVGTINAGNDLEMPGPGFLRKERVKSAFEAGLITQATIDRNVLNILRTLVRVGLVDDQPRVQLDLVIVNSKVHQRLAREAAEQGLVLLKNSGKILPLQATKLNSIAIIGPAAKDMQVGAYGSPFVEPPYKIQPFDAISQRLGKGVKVNYVEGLDNGQPISDEFVSSGTDSKPGFQAEYFQNRELREPVVAKQTDRQIHFDWAGKPVELVNHDNFSVRWTGKLKAPVSGPYTFTFTADDGCRLLIDGKPVIDHWQLGGVATYTGSMTLEKGRVYDIRAEYFQAEGAAVARLNWIAPGSTTFASAVAAAKSSDVAVVLVNTLGQEGEGADRPSMELPSGQSDLIAAVAKANPRTIVVLNTGTPVVMTKWLKAVPGLIFAGFPGQEGGAAIASVLFGDVNPSGKLPDTLATRREDYPDSGNFPGRRGKVTYEEGIYVGYRHFDHARIAPLFPFGHGLSYTTFRYGPTKLISTEADGRRRVSITVTNTGDTSGAEVVQLYVKPPKSKVDRPVQELKAFQKISVAPKEAREVIFSLDPRAFAYFDVPGKQWRVDPGTYRIAVGSSSRDIRSTVSLSVDKPYFEAVKMSREVVQPKAEVDLAHGKTAQASSVENRPEVGAAMAFDGDDQTRWSSEFSDPQWLAVDLGKDQRIDHVRIAWESAFASDYAIEISLDGKVWTEVYAKKLGLGGIEEVKFSPATARWVRLNARKRGTSFGVSVYSFEVFASK